MPVPTQQQNQHRMENAKVVSEEAERSIIEKALQKEKEEIVRKVIKIRIQRKGAYAAFQQSQTFPVVDKLAEYLKEYDTHQNEKGLRNTKLTGQDTVALFVTLSPEPGSVGASQLHDDIFKLLMKSKVGLEQVVWAIEQSGSVPEKIGEHPHVHILLLLDKTVEAGERARVTKWITGRLEKYKTKSLAYLDIVCVSAKKYEDKLNYIRGVKHAEKLAAVELDKKWRADNGWQDFYVFPESVL